MVLMKQKKSTFQPISTLTFISSMSKAHASGTKIIPPQLFTVHVIYIIA